MKLKINPEKRTKELGDLFGIFFEDLNGAADGGLYGEMLQNRSFEFDVSDNSEYNSMTGWERVQRGCAMTNLHVETDKPLNQNNPHYLVIDVAREGLGGIMNQGYNKGLRVEAGKQYIFSCFYRLNSKDAIKLCVRLESADGSLCYAEDSFTAESREWCSTERTLVSCADNVNARIIIGFSGSASIAVDMVSLFPEDTWMQRRNGMRADLAKMLADMKPKFMRFPGGCLVHCGSLNPRDRESMYRWKETIAPIENRTTWRNIWNYNQSLGLGYYEYFLLCEDIGTQPLPVIPAGWDPHTLRNADLCDMQEWIDEALDLVEFASGDENTPWGKRRCELGHPKPFNLKYLAIGNEEVGDEFFERYEIMHSAVQKKYPQIELIGSAGPGCGGTVFEQGWKQARELGASFVDEHFYQSPAWFIANVHRYDSYPANGPKAFLGEYASRGDTWYNALAEAAFMLGMEKAPGLGLACYAPLFCNAAYKRWAPDLIWFNQFEVYGTPSYHVQKLMMRNQGDYEVETLSDAPIPQAEPKPITGELAFTVERNDVSIEDIVLINLDDGSTITAPDMHLSGEKKEQLIADIAWTNYRISFRALRHMDCDVAHFVGQRPFALEFGRKDAENKLRFIIDGWMGMASVAQFIDGEFCELTTNVHPHMKDVWYDYALEVRGSSIGITMDGKPAPFVKSCEVTLEPLYSAASIEEASGDLIVKLVNLKSEKALVELDLNGFTADTAEVSEMSGFARDDRNSFEEMHKVEPTVTVCEPKLKWELKGESFTVLRFHNKH